MALSMAGRRRSTTLLLYCTVLYYIALYDNIGIVLSYIIPVNLQSFAEGDVYKGNFKDNRYHTDTVYTMSFEDTIAMLRLILLIFTSKAL